MLAFWPALVIRPSGNFLSGLYLKIQSQNYLRIYLHELLSFLTEGGASSLCLLFNKTLEHLYGQSWQERVFLSVYANIYCQLTIRGKGLNLHPNYLDIFGLENVMQGMCMSLYTFTCGWHFSLVLSLLLCCYSPSFLISHPTRLSPRHFYPSAAFFWR